jgi:hypothetical protein
VEAEMFAFDLGEFLTIRGSYSFAGNPFFQITFRVQGNVRGVQQLMRLFKYDANLIFHDECAAMAWLWLSS